MSVQGYTIKVKDNLFYKVWTPLTIQRWKTKELAKKALRKYLKRNSRLNPRHFKITPYRVDRRFG